METAIELGLHAVIVSMGHCLDFSAYTSVTIWQASQTVTSTTFGLCCRLESRNHIFGWRVLHCGIVDPVFIVVKKWLSPLTTACYTMNAQHCHCYTRIANCYNHCSNHLQSQPQCVFCVWFCGSGCANLSQLQPQWSYMMSMITTSGIAAANHCSCCSNNCTMYSPR